MQQDPDINVEGIALILPKRKIYNNALLDSAPINEPRAAPKNGLIAT